jgi:hypothetical protein
MSTYQRTKAGMLAADYARAFKVSIDDVVIEYREDDDAEIWAPGTGVVWTINGKPCESTLKKAQ